MKTVEFIRLRSFEEPFILAGQKFQFVTVRNADGREDIGVYAFASDLCFDYGDFREAYNLP